MKKLLSVFLLAVLSMSAQAETQVVKVFDLLEYEYGSLSTQKQYKYEFKDGLVVSLLGKTSEKNGFYNPKATTFVELAFFGKKYTNWVLFEDFHINFRAIGSLVFIDENGVELSIIFDDNDIRIKEARMSMLKHMSNKFKIIAMNNTLSVYLNDKRVHQEKSRFGKLKYIRHKSSGENSRIDNLQFSELK